MSTNAHKKVKSVGKIPPPPPKKSKKSKKSEEPDKCAICFIELTEEAHPDHPEMNVIKTLNCLHKFHTGCIDLWITRRITENIVPTCPTCITTILLPAPAPEPAPPRASPIDDDIAVVELQEQQNDRQLSMPFLGVIVLYRDGGKRLNNLKTYLNTDLGLTLNSTLRNLKDAILERPNELAVQCPILSEPRARVFIHNLFSSQSKQASFVIERMYFGTPAGINTVFIARDYPSNIHSNMPYGQNGNILDYNNDDDNKDMETIYREYREKARDILERGTDTFYRTTIRGREVGFSPLKDVFNRKIEYSLGRRIDNVGVNYFYNHSNPDIPEEFRPEMYLPLWPGVETEILKKSTKIPLAWMIVEVGCDTFRGGKKTRRNKSRRNKSQRNRSVR